MADQQRSQELASQDTRQQQQRPQDQHQAQPPQAPSKPPAERPIDTPQQAQTGKQSTFKAGQSTVTLGRAGEHNLAAQWIDVELDPYMSVRFEVKTAAGNALEVQVEQVLYKKNYSGSGSVSTTVVPGAPIGTKGKLTARDTATGEMLEVPWTWYDRGRRGLGLWTIIKRLIWKSGA